MLLINVIKFKSFSGYLINMPSRTLVICIDRDADLKVKVNISGPIVGRQANLDAANMLLLADPEEVDGNTIFEAIRNYDLMKSKGEDVEIVTLVGDKSRSYLSDREITNQLDNILSEFNAESCIVVTDGADDEQILPILSSRIKIDSVRQVSMKQSKELERTYFLVLEKLREPYFARMFIGIPALIILSLVISYSLGLEWKPVAGFMGIYLLAKGFGIEDRILEILSNFKFNSEQLGSISYIISIPLFAIAIWLSIDEFMVTSMNFDNLRAISYGLRTLVLFTIPAFGSIYLGQLYDSLRSSNNLLTLRMMFYILMTSMCIYLIWMFAGWVITEAYFSELVSSILVSILVIAISMELVQFLKRDLIKGVDLLGKEVFSSSGSYLGKIVSTNDDEKILVYLNPWKKRISIEYNQVKDIGQKINLL
jgi:putative membrane protein